MDVVLVRWPAEAQRRIAAAARCEPRLLLVENGVAPPDPAGCLEDWVRVPASEAEVRARLAGLKARAAEHAPPGPVVDADGLVRHGDGWVALPPVEARLTHALIERYGRVVSRERLALAGWPDGVPGRNALDVHVLRLRRRLRPLGLAIHTVRSRGYVLGLVEGAQASSR